MNIIEVIKFIRKSKDQHFISVDREIWDRWSWLIRIAVWSNKNYVPCIIYRRKYKFLPKKVKKRVSSEKDYLKEFKNHDF